MEQVTSYLQHIATSGEMWDEIALQYYNDEKMMSTLLSHNRSLCNIVIFRGGEKVRIPVIAEQDISNTLPPWRR